MLPILKYRLVGSVLLALAFPLILTACSGGGSDSDNQATSPPGSVTQPNIKFSSNVIDARVGSTFTIDVVLDLFPVTEGGGINIAYAADILQVKDILINNKAWDFVTQQGSIDNATGVVSNVLVSSFQGVEDAAVIATITFEAISSGGSDITLSESTLNPFAAGGDKLNPLFVSSHVTVR